MTAFANSAQLPSSAILNPATTGSLTFNGVPQAERLSLQVEASGLVNMIAQAHERLDRLMSAPAMGQNTPTPALPVLSESIMAATCEMTRLLHRLDALVEKVGQI